MKIRNYDKRVFIFLGILLRVLYIKDRAYHLTKEEKALLVGSPYPSITDDAATYAT